MTDTMMHDTHSIVDKDQVVCFQDVSCHRHQAIIKVPPSIDVPDVDTIMFFPVPVVEVNTMLGRVDLVVSPSVGNVTRTSTGDQSCLSATRHHVVVEDRLSCSPDVDAPVELHAEGEVLEMGNSLTHRDEIPNDPCASALVKDSRENVSIDDIALHTNVVGSKDTNGSVVVVVEATVLDIALCCSRSTISFLMITSVHEGKRITRIIVVRPTFLTSTDKLHI